VLLHADVSRDYPMAAIAEGVCAAIPGLRRVSLSDTAAWKADTVDADILADAPSDPDAPVMQAVGPFRNGPLGEFADPHMAPGGYVNRW
jgi:hypothetical protein